jgi:Uri superfamily endonuclease
VWNCYILILELHEPCSVVVASRRVELKPGVYFYIGSARGPGGALARITRHLAREKKAWWHIDKLLACPKCRVHGVLLVKAVGCDCEVEVSRALRHRLSGVAKFGCSDKRLDYSHLYRCSSDIAECSVYLYSLLEKVECLIDLVYAEL